MATAARLYSKKVPMVFAEYLMDWMEDNNAINILVTGQTGSGKSTLINSVLGISTAPERQTVQRAKPTSLTSYQNRIGDVQVTMWDSPGLGEPSTDKSKAKAVESIKKDCRDIDLCLFCTDMSLSRFTPGSIEAMKTLNDVYGADKLWKNTVFVLTFANEFLLRIDADYQQNPEGKKRKFESEVELWREKLYMHLEKHLNVDPNIAHNAKVVPVGNHHSHQLFQNISTRWLNELWLQAISATRHIAKPAVIKIYQQLLGNIENDQLHVTFTLLTQETSGTSPAIDIPLQERDDDRPQGQSFPN